MEEQPSPPAHLPPIPRAVRMRRGYNLGTWFARIFVLPHLSVGVVLVIGVLWYSLFSLLTGPLGTKTTGHLVSLQASHTSSGKSLHYVAVYRYEVGGTTYEESDGIDEALYQKWSTPGQNEPPGIPVTVSQFTLGSLHGARLADSGASGPVVLPLLFVLGFAGFWNYLMVGVLRVLWILPPRQRWLVRRGTAVLGHVTGTRKQLARRTIDHLVAYEFADPATGELCSGETRCVDLELWNQAHQRALLYAREPLTVLYDPARPDHNLAYEYCPYAAKPSRR